MEVSMDIEEMMIDFILNKATKEQRDEFFGFSEYELTKECCEDNLFQMPDNVFDELVRKFGLPTDGVKL